MFLPQGQGIQGQVTVAVGSSFGAIVLPGAIVAFQAAYPGVRLRLVDDNSEGITRRVRLADADLGIGSPVGDVDALACRTLLRAPLGLLAPPERFEIADADARGVPRLPLLRESADTSILHLLRMHGSALLAPMSQGVEVSSLAIQLALADAGVGVAVLSALGASHPLARGMRFVPLQPPVERELFILRRRDRSQSLAARAFEDTVVRHLPQAALRAEVTLSN